MVEAMHNIVLRTIKVTIQKTTYILVSCDKITMIYNQNWLNVHVYAPYINGVYCMVHRTNLVVQTLGGLNLVTKIESLLSSTYNYFAHLLKRHANLTKLVKLLEYKGNKILKNIKTS
jgi:hypothetical protein